MLPSAQNAGKTFCGRGSTLSGTRSRQSAQCKTQQAKDAQERFQKAQKSKQKKVQEPPLPEIEGEPAEDGYDGYYDDILPPDLDREKEGPDKELIKKIVSLTVAVIFIIGLCVVMMYVL